MWKMIVRRVLILIPQLIAISILVFILAQAMPGDAISGMIDPNLTAADLAHQRELLGLNDPLPIRYWNWITGIILEGDFGQSFRHRRAVSELIAERVANTFYLALFTLILTYAIAIPLGILAGRFKGTIIDKSILLYIMVALSMPTLVMGLVLIISLAYGLQWFPAGGSVSALVLHGGNTWEIFTNYIHHMILPALSGALVGTTGIIFMLRANIIDRTYSDYVVMARSKGVPTRVIFNKHVLRNSLIPVTAGIGFAIVGLLMGTIFIEMIFVYPGVGTLFLDSISVRDFAVVNALILMFSSLTAIGMLISDILLTIVDPRIRIR